MKNINTLPDGLIAYYPLTTSARDDFGEIHGTINNGATIIPQGVKLDGTNDYVDLGTSSKLSLTGVPFSVLLWVKVASNGNYHYIISDVNVSFTQSTVDIYRRNDNKFGFFHGNATLIVLSNITTVVDQWYHLACVRSGGTGSWTLKMYVDGKLQNTSSGASNPSTGGTLCVGRVGSYPPTGFYHGGCTSELSFYNRALTLNEIQEHYVNTRGLYL